MAVRALNFLDTSLFAFGGPCFCRSTSTMSSMLKFPSKGILAIRYCDSPTSSAQPVSPSDRYSRTIGRLLILLPENRENSKTDRHCNGSDRNNRIQIEGIVDRIGSRWNDWSHSFQWRLANIGRPEDVLASHHSHPEKYIRI